MPKVAFEFRLERSYLGKQRIRLMMGEDLRKNKLCDRISRKISCTEEEGLASGSPVQH